MTLPTLPLEFTLTKRWETLQLEVFCCCPELPTEVVQIVLFKMKQLRSIPKLLIPGSTPVYAVDWVEKAICPALCPWQFKWSIEYEGSTSLNQWLRTVRGSSANMDYYGGWACPGCSKHASLAFLR